MVVKIVEQREYVIDIDTKDKNEAIKRAMNKYTDRLIFPGYSSVKEINIVD